MRDRGSTRGVVHAPTPAAAGGATALPAGTRPRGRQSPHGNRGHQQPHEPGALGLFCTGRGLRRHCAAHALLHHGRHRRRREHGRLGTRPHVGAGRRRGGAGLQRDGRAGLGAGRQFHLRRAARAVAVGLAGRRAVRLRHGAGLGLRQQEPAAPGQRQPQGAGGGAGAGPERLRHAAWHHRRAAREHASRRSTSNCPRGQDLPTLGAAASVCRRRPGAGPGRHCWRCCCWCGC